MDSDRVLTLAPGIEQDVGVGCRVPGRPEDAKGSPDGNVQAKLPNDAGGRGHDGQANGVVLLLGNLGSPLARFQHITYKDRDVGAFVLLWIATWRERRRQFHEEVHLVLAVSLLPGSPPSLCLF